MRRRYTYFELSPSTDFHYYAVITTKEGFEYYIGGFKSKSAAYRFSKKHSFQRKY